MTTRGAYGKSEGQRHPKTLGGRIRNIRLFWGWTQTQLAEALQSKQAVISRWEQDTMVPSGPALRMLASIFRLTPEALLTGKGYTVTPPPLGDAEKRSNLSSLLVQLPMTDQGVILHMDYASEDIHSLNPKMVSKVVKEAIEKKQHVWIVIK